MNFSKTFLFIVAFSSLIISSQQLDESFLSSLPESLKDSINENSDDTNNKDKNYSNPETRIQKLESALESAEKNLMSIKSELRKDEDAEVGLRRIGQKFFNTYQSTFLPINEPNSDSSYILDVGDELTIQIIGQKNKTYELSINRQGSINIPDIGELNLAGLSLNNAVTTIKEKLNNAYIGIDAFISISSLRDFNVLITGNVENPGMYTLSGGSTPLSLLFAAGGIDDNGSYRRITHKRNNVILQNIDLYSIFLDGNFNFKSQLRSGDILLVHPKQSEIRIQGSFSNPGIYEVLPGETLDKFLKWAGPINLEQNEILNLVRYSSNKVEQFSINFKDSSSFVATNGDNVSLFSKNPELITAKNITITGEVQVPAVT